VSVFIERARISLRSVAVLLELGDTNSAGSRAYYAIFDAMRAVLSERTDLNLESIKTHHGLFMMFERHILATGLMDAEKARIIYRTQELRWSADYSHAVQIEKSAVSGVIRPASDFIEACARLVAANGES
jgi:uncharacterized protein (UPF0332 family)